MTSGQFSNIPVNSIEVHREARQRQTLSGIEELANSIRISGLINPIVVTRDHVLVAGERRLTAHKLLGYDTITAQFVEDLDPLELQLIELEENVRREDLTWAEQVQAVSNYHRLRSESEPGWSAAKTAEALHMSPSNIGNYLLVNKMMEEKVPEVLEAPKLSTAINFAQRKAERQKSSALRELRQDIAPVKPEVGATTAVAPDRFAAIEQANFHKWAEQIRTTPFNLIHCDFPYGRNTGDKKGQSGAKSYGGYDDSAEIYFDLLATLTAKQDNFIAPSAHMLFWFSMDYYTQTQNILREAGWRVDIFPFIWHKSDNSGIIPDVNRGPRRTYETAFFCTRGDRKIVRAVSNSVAATTVSRTEKIHMSEKPPSVLAHFFKMMIDSSTVMLDPTCGSGNAVKVAESLGASWSLGLELSPEYVERARESLSL